MSESAFQQITARNKDKHDHWNGQTERCPYCANFVSLSVDGQFRKGVCSNCGKAILRYRNQKQAV